MTVSNGNCNETHRSMEMSLVFGDKETASDRNLIQLAKAKKLMVPMTK